MFVTQALGKTLAICERFARAKMVTAAELEIIRQARRVIQQQHGLEGFLMAGGRVRQLLASELILANEKALSPMAPTDDSVPNKKAHG